MTVGTTTTDFSQGNLSIGTNLDIAIVGEGFFIVSESPQTFDFGSDKFYTRAGRFQVDFSNRFLTDSFGRKFFGFELDAAGNPISSTPVAMETKGFADIGFIDGGVLVANFQARKDAIAAGDADPPAHIPLFSAALATFTNKQGLVQTNGAAFRPTIAAGDVLPPGVAGDSVFGQIKAESLESTNVEVSRVALRICCCIKSARTSSSISSWSAASNSSCFLAPRPRPSGSTSESKT